MAAGWARPTKRANALATSGSSTTARLPTGREKQSVSESWNPSRASNPWAARKFPAPIDECLMNALTSSARNRILSIRQLCSSSPLVTCHCLSVLSVPSVLSELSAELSCGGSSRLPYWRRRWCAEMEWMSRAMAFRRKPAETMAAARKSKQCVSELFSVKYNFFAKQTQTSTNRPTPPPGPSQEPPSEGTDGAQWRYAPVVRL